MLESDPSYEVGYRKPPKGTQFVQGQSGNPKGRPKGSKNLATLVLRESRRIVRANGPRGALKITKVEATLMQMGNKSAQGDLRASRDFLSLIQWSEENASSKNQPNAPNEADRQVIEILRRRMERETRKDPSHNDQPEKENQNE